MLEYEAFEMPILSLDKKRKAKGEEETTHQQSLTPVEPAPKGIDEAYSGDNIEWIQTWHARDSEEKGLRRKYKEILMGSVINLQAKMSKGNRDRDG